jgi:enoyl-CoA hydratase
VQIRTLLKLFTLGEAMSVTLEIIEPHIALLRVDRPQVRNALGWESMVAFNQAVEQAHKLQDLRALILAGSREAFIAGGDLKALHGATTQADGLRLAKMMGGPLKRLEALPCPTLAAMNGPSRGGGAEIALACDLRVMGAAADFGLVQVTLGLTPGWGGGQRLLRLVGYSRALEWLATGKILTAQEMLAHGLANRVSPKGRALEAALELAREIAVQPLNAVRAIKRLLRAGLMLPGQSAARVELDEFPTLWASEEHLQAMKDFLERKSS